MADKAEKLAAAKKRFKEFQSQKQKKEGPPSDNVEVDSQEFRKDFHHEGKICAESLSPSTSVISNTNGRNSSYGGSHASSVCDFPINGCKINVDENILLSARNCDQEYCSPSLINHSENSSVPITDYLTINSLGNPLLDNQYSNYNLSPKSNRANTPLVSGDVAQMDGAKNDEPNLITEQKKSNFSKTNEMVTQNNISQERNPDQIISSFELTSLPTNNFNHYSSYNNSHENSQNKPFYIHPVEQNLYPANSEFNSQAVETCAKPKEHPSRILLRQFSQIETDSQTESISNSVEQLRLGDSVRQKKNFLDFHSSKSSSAESERMNNLFIDPSSSSDSMMPRRTDSVSTVYSSSDNQERKLSILTNYTVGDSFDHPSCDILELEKRSEELASLLNGEKLNTSELKSLLSESENQVKRLQNEVLRLQTSLNEVVRETTKSYECQSKNYIKTIEILVSEKSELETKLSNYRKELSSKDSKIEDLNNQLSSLRHQVVELERELGESSAVKIKLQETEDELLSARNDAFLARNNAEELTNDVKEMKQKLESKSNELNQIKEELQAKNSQLSLCQLRIQQLSSNDGVENCDNELKVLQDVNTMLTAKVSSLEQTVRTLELERDNASSNYQQYVRSLNSELQALKANFEALSNEKDSLFVREENLVKHVSELEKQLQSRQSLINELSAKNQDPINSQTDTIQQQTDKIMSLEREKKSLEEKCHSILEENERLAAQIIFKESKLEQLEAEQIDMSSLQATIESDRVAASRAIEQNNKLKEQLQELQNAIVTMSNNKLDLTEKLEHERFQNKDLSARLSKVTNEVQKSYVEVETSTDAQEFIEKAEFAEFAESIDKSDISVQTETETKTETVIDVEAVAKLEEKFRKTMKELADLSDEKQRLEHLVLQLQSETETIGEYVALYQTQRGMLQEKAKEKDLQVVRLAQDKENLRNKLAQLTELIKSLISKHDPSHESATLEDLHVTKDDITVDADQIMNLLSDIGASSLAHSVSNFHPCPWCSGQLITV